MKGATVYGVNIHVGHKSWRMNTNWANNGFKFDTFEEAENYIRNCDVQKIYKRGCFISQAYVVETQNYLTSESKVIKHRVKATA